jgi:hypothetical protein
MIVRKELTSIERRKKGPQLTFIAVAAGHSGRITRLVTIASDVVFVTFQSDQSVKSTQME